MIHHIIYEMISINGNDTRRINHALKVYSLARCIAGREETSDDIMQIVCVAAILHDIAIRHCEQKFGACGGKLQEQEGPAIARPILEKHTNDTTFIDRVLHIIAHHHSPNSIDAVDLQIVIEADYIVNADEGDITHAAFETVYCKYFKTTAGKHLADIMLRGA